MKKLLFLSYFLLVTIVTINAQCWQNFASGANHSLALKGDGTLWSWGSNNSSQLGDGTTASRATPVQIGSATNWKSISAGGFHSMGVKTDGTLWAWGDNTYGQLGDGTNANKSVPVQIGAATNWLFINLGDNHSLAIKTDGTLWACGLNSSSQLGDGTSVDKNTFVQIGTATNWQSASGGENFTMAIQTNGTLWGFGNNSFRQLGDGTTIAKTTPTQIGAATNWSVVASGQGHSVAVKTDGTLWSWGTNIEGALGTATTQNATPTQIGTATNWRAVGAQYRHSLATKTDGTFWSFGYNDGGQLGDGTTVNKNTPVQIGTGTNWLYPDAGAGNSYSIKTDGTIWSSGYGYAGQLGDGTTTVFRTSPVQVITTCTAASLNFDGVDDKVALGAFSVNGTASRTVEFWLKTPITGVFQNPFSSGTANTSQAFNIKVTPTGHLGFMGFANDNYPSTGTIIADNTYHHVALTYNGTNIKAYVDGNLEWTFAITLATTGTNNYIGASNHAGNEQYFPGTIDELRVWNVARTQCEINTYKNCEIPTTSAGLLANYHFNQGLDASPNPTVTLLTDAAGSAFTGTLTTFALTGTTSNWVAPGGVVSGYTTTLAPPVISASSGSIIGGSSFTMVPGGGVSYTYLPSGPIVIPSTSSTYTVTGTSAAGCTNTAISTVSVQGAALNFDGGNDFVSIGTLIPLNSSYTKEAWIYANASGSNNIISSGSAAFWLSAGRLSAFNNGGATISDPAAFPLNQWVHVAVSLNAANGILSLFRNGVLVASGSSNTGYAADAIAIGQYGPSSANFFQGAMDEVKIWNRALCASEIQNNMNAELPSGQTGLLSYYKMNQGFASLANPTATILIDASGNSNNAPLSNFAYAGNTSNWIAPGAVITGSTAVFFNSPISASAATTSISCGGSATGSATITASGGAPYTYSWSPSVGTTSVVTGLSAGNYTVLVTGTCGVRTVTLSIAAPPAITLTPVSQTNVSCFGGSNGAAQVSASGGTGTLTYNWTPGTPTGDGTTSITGLTAGSWTCTVTDANSCTKTQNFTVTQPPAITLNASSQTNVACFGGSTGAAQVNAATGGAGGFTYDWTPGTPTGDGTTSITGLTANTWTCTVTDANACTKTQNFTVTQPPAITLNASSQTNVSCFGGSNGATSVNAATGGAGGFTYDWTPGTPTGDGTTSVTGLTANTWTCTVTDANACTKTQNFTVTQPPAITLNAASQTNVACFGGSTGAAQVNAATGGAGGFTYNWTLGTPTGDGTTSVTGLTAGSWTCTVTDVNGCSKNTAFNVTQPASNVSGTTIVTNVACFGGTNGTIDLTPTGGTPGYTYNWGGGITTQDRTGLTAGAYAVTITDANGCTGTVNATITQPTAIIATTTQTNVICFGASTGMASVSASGGTGAYTYSWSPNGGNAATAINLIAGTYTNTITDANGCSLDNSFVITENAAITSVVSATNCNSYTLNGTTYTSSGTYIQTLANASSMGCDSTITLNLMINQSTSSTLTEIACSMYTLNGTTYNTSGTYTQLLTNAAGCDSTITLNLTINQPTSATLTEVACSSYVLNGTTYNTSGTYTQLLTNTAGCDSTITLNLTINQPTSSTLTEVACSSYVLNGTTYNTSGTYTQLLTNTAGCDSTITLNLTINQPTSSSLTEVACSSYVLNGTTYNTSGTYTQLLTNVAGCDSTITLDLTINGLPAIMAMTSNTLLCTGETATLSVMGSATSYTWSTSETTMDIVVSPTTTTTYTVDGMDANGCSNTTTITQDVSLCTGIATVAEALEATITIYPNPNNGIFSIALTKDSKVSILNALGQTIVNEDMNSGKHVLDIHNEANGIYFVKVIQDNKQQIIKIIKE